MADILQNVEEVYKKWESKSAPRLKSRFPFNGRQSNCIEDQRRRNNHVLRNTFDDAPHFERRKRQRFPGVKLPKYHGIAPFKMAPTILPLNKQRPFTGLCCMKCLPQSRACLPNYVQSLCVCNLFHVPFWGNIFPVIPSSLRLLFFMFSRNSKFTYPDVSQKVMQCERVSSAIKDAVEASDLGIASSTATGGQRDDCFEALVSRQKAAAEKLLQSMKCSINQFFLRVSGWVFYKMLSLMIQSIQVHKGHLEVLKSACQEEYPLVYVPLHRSHLDYIVISLVLYMNSFKVPIFTTRDDFAIPFFSQIFRFLGASFVKSSTGSGKKEVLYRAILQSYLTECLKVGHSVEIFIEGGRSHTGKPRMPQTGLLSVVAESLLEGEFEDVYIVPVTISYEKLIEGNFVSEQLGKQKACGSFLSSLFSMWKIIHANYGSIRVDFCQPFSLKEFLQSSNHSTANLNNKLPHVETPPSSPGSSCSSSRSFCGNVSTPSNLEAAIKNLADHIVFDATCSTALMCTQLIAFLFLTKHRQGATQPQLLCSFNYLKDELMKRKWNVGFMGDSISVIKYAISLLGKDLLHTEAIELEWTSSDMENNNVKVLFHRPVIKLPYVLELQYYANAAIPAFLLDSIVVNALYAVVDDEICHFQLCDSKLFVWRDELVDKAVMLQSFFRFEFIFIPPCADITLAVNDVIDELIAKECLTVTGVSKYGSGQKPSRRGDHMSFEPSDEEEYFGGSEQHLKIDLSEESIDYLKFLRNILSPYIESYWLAACTLLKLIHEVVEEKEFLREIQRTAEDRLHKGLLRYEESFGTETLKNSLKVFESWQVIEHYYEDEVKFIFLSDYFDCEEKVSIIISRIEEFRQ